ncbi:DNA-binding beta-propeller fold protein YncE [Mitsuaria sp. BK045]|uniref:YncE family protein n=1 Tax=unclassified Roseateles TaxID=2626991 RepID=UPI0018037FA2|nr:MULTISPECIES: YncE family protein [unclassified Roseateles]MBB3294473.1 DNA-binding beta-propeller fold protein YncE [Mitsuaria sp. BK041]MBB3363689.1 DNA-binding beta-propeller fold protein YncE [Mitsuaria sp. BK045]
MLSSLARPLLAALAVALSASIAAPSALATTGSPIFVLNSLDADVSVIDPKDFRQVKRIPIGKEPHHLYLTPDRKTMVVANALGDSLTFLDPVTAEVQRTVHGIPDPYHLRFSPDMKWLVLAGNRLDHVDIYKWQPQNAAQPLALFKRFSAPKTPSHLSIDTKSSVVYASLQDSSELLAIDLNTMAPRWKIPVGKLPADLYLTPDDKYLLVALTGERSVEVYDVGGAQPRLVKKLETGDGAHSFRALGDRKHVLVSNRAANTISKIALADFKVVDTFKAPGGPDDMEILTDGRTLMFTSRWARKLTVMDLQTKQILQQVKVGKSPHGVWTLDQMPRQ